MLVRLHRDYSDLMPWSPRTDQTVEGEFVTDVAPQGRPAAAKALRPYRRKRKVILFNKKPGRRKTKRKFNSLLSEAKSAAKKPGDLQHAGRARARRAIRGFEAEAIREGSDRPIKSVSAKSTSKLPSSKSTPPNPVKPAGKKGLKGKPGRGKTSKKSTESNQLAIEPAGTLDNQTARSSWASSEEELGALADDASVRDFSSWSSPDNLRSGIRQGRPDYKLRLDEALRFSDMLDACSRRLNRPADLSSSSSL